MAISPQEAKTIYETHFGPVGSKSRAHEVVNKVYSEYSRLFPDEPLDQNFMNMYHQVNLRLDQDLNRPVHNQGTYVCDRCYRDIYSFCTVCVGPHDYIAFDRMPRSYGVSSELICDECRIGRVKKSATTKAVALHRLKAPLSDPAPGSMTWAEHMGEFYGKLRQRSKKLPQKFRTVANCMEAEYQDPEGLSKKFTKDHLYFMAKGMGLLVTKRMLKHELCDLISSHLQ